MSAFLGPIHFWLYNKIILQQELVEEIIKLSKQSNLKLNLEQELDNKYGTFEKRPLEEAIDQGNIHGWLQSCVSQAEYKLAYAVTQLININPDIFKEIELLFQSKGAEKSISGASDNPSQIFKAISDCLLDGMPCDHANSVLAEDEIRVVWKRNTCVHKDYWEQVGGEINNYYVLREAFIKGFLKDTVFIFEKIDDVTSVIRKL